jgi:hypothetical protein
MALMVALLALTIVALPTWPYSRTWTYYPAYGCFLAATAIVLLVFGGRL